MKSDENIRKLVKKLRIQPDETADARIRENIAQALQESKQPTSAETKSTIWRIIMKSRITKLASAAVIVIAAFTIGLQLNTSGVAWGALVERIESVESVVYHLTTNVRMQNLPEGQTPPKTEAIAYYSSEHGTRVECYMNEKLSFTMYLNPKESIYVSVMSDTKKFMKYNKSPDEIRQISEKDDPREIVKHMMSTDYVELGRDNIDGMDVEGIECTGPRVMGGMFEEATARLWVETGTDFPVRIEVEGVVAGGQMEMSMVMDDFQWNAELDPALFVPDIPPDYTPMEVNFPGADEGAAINGLRLFAELTDGRYPDNLAFMTLMKEISEAFAAKYGKDFAEKTVEAEYADALQNMLAAGTFYMQLVGKEQEAEYYGDSVTVDNPEAVLLRWKVSDGVYRVIFGDLTAENVSADQLTELENPPSQ